MKKILIFVVSVLMLTLPCMPIFGWGGKGHNIIANIAEAHLTKRAKKEVQKLLNGHTMVYYSTWMDELRGDSAYNHTLTWHYANVDEGKTYETMVKVPEGDVVTATMLSIEQLRNKNLNDSLRSMYLKYLIHLVGDMHCPMHAGRATDLGGNRYSLLWRDEKINLHQLWDSQIVDAARNWNSLEWATYIDVAMDKKQQRKMEAGSPLDWFKETAALAKDIYDNTPENQNVPRNYVRRYTPLLEGQFLKAGYRLAGLLNAIFK